MLMIFLAQRYGLDCPYVCLLHCCIISNTQTYIDNAVLPQAL